MASHKSPGTFTDGVLLRELRRRIDRVDDDRMELLLDEVENRLWDAERARALEARIEDLEAARRGPPQLRVVKGGGDA